MRSAWMAALLSDGHTVAHDMSAHDAQAYDGWSSSVAGCCYPDWTIDNAKKLVIVERDSQEARLSTTKFLERAPIDWTFYEKNLQKLIKGRDDALRVDYRGLDDYDICAYIVSHCTGQVLTPARWQVFDKLKIEQHLPKVRSWLFTALSSKPSQQ